MSVEEIRNALVQIQDDPDDVGAWTTVEDGVMNDSSPEVVRELEMSRVQHERVRNWATVARLLELELALDDEPAITGAKQLELARIYHEELFLDDEAMKAYRRAEELKPGEDKIRIAIGEIEFGRANLGATVEQALVEALDSEDNSVRVPMLLRAAECTFRWGGREDDTVATVADFVRQALELEPASQKGQTLAAAVYAHMNDWTKLAEVLDAKATTAPTKDEKIAAAYQLALVTRTKLDDDKRGVDAHQLLLDLDPANRVALQYLVDHFSKAEDWDHLEALYEDQLRSGVVKQADELGMWIQLAMLNWKTRKRPQRAEPYFDKIRRVDPTHASMLAFFREYLMEDGDTTRLMSILTDAQRALDEDSAKAVLAEEIAELAEGQENARRAIEQYKTILRSDPDNEEARAKLKALYLETESHNALIELYRQDLQRTEKTEHERRIAILRDIASIYRDKMEGSDTALLTVYTQILQHDENDIDAVRGLVKVYENLGRWRDLLNTQQKMAELTDNATEKESLLRAVARRWLDQFSNVQNAIGAYEALLAATGGKDPEARDKLGDLYKKRRAWDKLYELSESQLDSLEGDARTELMLEMARLAAERLNRGDDAIRLLKEVLVFDPSAEGVLDQLERQAERQKDYETVAHVLDRRIDAAEDDKVRLALLQKLGVLFSDKLENAEASNEAWRRVLEISPGHKRALRVLRAHYVEAADWPGLEALYASQEDWEGLADFMSTTADKSKDDAQKVELSFRAARIYVERLQAPERAARSYERVLGIDDKNVEAARALLPIYTEDEKWSRLPGLYEVLLEATEDVDEKIEILHRVAEITGGPLANKTAALGYARKAYELRPNEEGLERLHQWSQQSGEWSAFIEVVKARLEDGDLGEDRTRELSLMLAEVYAGEGERMDDAVAIYRGLLEADPTDERTASAFEGLLRAADRRDDLRWLFELKVGQAEGEEQCVVLEEWATVEEEVFGEPERAVELLRRVVDTDATRTSALSSLTRLLLAAEDYQGARVIMTAHRDATHDEERVEIETRLAQLGFEHLEDPSGAYEACVRALAIEPAHPPVVELLEQLMDVPQTRAQAASSLERIYAESGASEKQVGALRALLESVEGAERRLSLCLRLADVHEHELGDSGGAFEVILNTLLDAPGDLTLWDRVQELGVKAGRPTDLAEAYRKHLAVGDQPVSADEGDASAGDEAAAPGLERQLRLELCERAAVLHEEQLGDVEGAVPYLERMLAIEPRNERAFDRLKAILNSVERWGELEKLYQRTIEVTEDDAQKIDLLHQAALVAEDMIGNDEKAIGYYERITTIDSLHIQATEALERLYGREERFDHLAALLERRLETATDDEALPIQKQLVELYLHQLEDHERVMGHLENVLRQRDDDLDARALAEECLQVPSLRQAAATLLDHVYEAADDPRDLVRVLDVRLEGAADDDQRRALLHRIAALRDERLKDDDASFEAYRALMPLEPDDPEIRERMLDVGRRLGENEKMAAALLTTADKTSVPSVSGQILMEAAGIFRDRLNDLAQAEKVYRRVLAIDEDEPELVIVAAKALAEIYQGEGKHQKLAEVLGVQVRLVSDTEERSEIYARIADLYEDLLEDDQQAIAAWKARLSDDTADTTALRALERLYERTAEWRELVEVLHHLEQAAVEGDERKRCMVKAAEVLATELGETSDAINGWRAVLDDFGPEPDTLAALSKLYELAERWEDLAEVYDVWISLTDEMSERVGLFAGLGDVRRKHLDDPHGALGAYREVLTIEPTHAGAREALASMLEHADHDIKREAAEIIGPLYEADGDAERLLTVLNIEIESTFDPTDKLETLERALRTAEDTVGSATQAFDYACRGVRDAIGQPGLAEWISTAERLAAETSRQKDLLALFEEVVDEILDAEVQQSTRLRAGELARESLEDTARAITHYRAALEARTDDQRAMIALVELYEATNNNRELLEILKLRAESAESDAERIELSFRVAELQAGPLEAREAAIETYEDIINMSLDDRAVDALEKLYSRASRYDDLVALYERLVDTHEGDELADIRVKIATVAHQHLSDTARALDELGEALDADADHKAAIATLERLLEAAEEPEQRSQVAEMLEPVYLAAHDWDKLKGALEARLETSQDPSARGELLMRLATLYEEQLEDYSSALDTVAKRLREDPADEDIWGEVERLGRVLGEGNELRVAEIFASALNEVPTDDQKTATLSARTGELFDEAGKLDEALKWYTRSYEYRPDSTEAFEAIDSLLVRLERKEDRIYHYRQALDNTFDDATRVRYLHVVAQLQRELEQDDDAIETLRELLDSDESNAEALDALTELHTKNEQTEELADLYERRAELVGEAERAAPYRLALARLLKKDDESRDRALDQLDIIVMELPSNAEAIAELEEMLDDSERKQRVIDLLRPIYEQASNWEGLVRLDNERMSLADLPDEKVDVLMNTAQLWEDQGEDPRKAFDVVREAFELVPENEDTRANLERLAESLNAWTDLADSYTGAVKKIEDDFARRQLLSALATVCDQQLDDPRRALAALAQISDADPSDADPLVRMDTLATLLADWPLLVTVLSRKAENADNPQDRCALLQRQGDLKRDMLADEPGAIAVYERALEIAPDSVGTLDRLIQLYDGEPAPAPDTEDDEPVLDAEQRARRLAELLEQRIDFAEPASDERHKLILHAAEVHEKRLESADDAIRMLQIALDERPTDEQVLAALEGLYRAQELYDELLDNLKTQASVATEPERRLTLRNKIGDLYIEKLDNAFDALEQYRLVLDEDEADAHAIDKTMKIADGYEELRLEVSALLEPVLTAAGRNEELVAMMEHRFSAQTDPVERARTLAGIALIQEEQLDAPENARDTLLRALVEAPDDAQLHEDINRLCELTEEWAKYADILSERAEEIYDAVVQSDLFTRLGRIAEERLADKERAIAAFQRAAEQAENPGDLLESLDRLYESTEKWEELGKVLERRAEIEENGSDQAELYYRLGKLQIGRFDNRDSGLAFLRQAADLNAEHEGVRAELEKLTEVEELFEEVADTLDTMYRVAQDSAGRAKLRNKRISYAPTAADRVRLRLELAQMLEDESFDTKSAQEVIQQALFDDASDADVLEQLERLAKVNAAGNVGVEAWKNAADALGEAVAKALEVEGGESTMTSELARDLYLRSASWYNEHVEDAEAAEKRLRAALAEDARSVEALTALEQVHRSPGREKDLVETLRALAALSDAQDVAVERTSRELRREAKTLVETALDDAELAEQILRDMLNVDDADVWALTELCAVCEKKEAWQELFTLLTRRMDLTPEAAELRELRHQAARVAANELDDSGSAIGLYEQAFEDDSGDEVASEALRELYTRLERFDDMLRFSERLIEMSDSADERAKLRLESARICIEVLNAPTEGIENLHAVLEEVPGHEGAVELLCSMLEKEGRDDELADLLKKQIDLAREDGEQKKELGFRVKLAELYESRLNDPDKAIEGYLGVLEADDAFRPALEALARLYEQQENPRSAAEMYEKLIASGESEDIPRLVLKARDLYVDVDDREAASRVLEEALDKHDSLASDRVEQLRDGLRTLYREREAWDKLAGLIEKEAEEAEGHDEKVVKFRKAAEIHAKDRDDHAAAAGLLEKALELKSDDRDLMLSLCDEYTASGRGKDAIDVLNRVVESYGGRRSKELADIHHRIANAHLAEGDKGAAMKDLESARKMDPGSVVILNELGTLSLRMADDTGEDRAEHLKRAGNAFRSLLLQRLDADSPVSKSHVFYSLALVSQAEGDDKKAKQMAERALANDKSFEKAKTLLDELKG